MRPQTHEYWVNEIQKSKYIRSGVDTYNEGPLVNELENRIATLLKKPRAQFYTKGTTCQLAALKVHCDAYNKHKVLLHPQSHIALDEQDAYQALMGLEGILVGQVDQPITLLDIQSISFNPAEIACLVIELPLRRAGFKLPEWQELLNLRKWCDDHQIIMHMDGARLWESAFYYQRPWDEIAALFDSIYVSLYKGLGGMGGAVLAGKTSFLKQCEVWRNRLGSSMWSSFPYLITALHGLDENLGKINSWSARAAEIAQSLSKIKGLIIEPPQTNGFQIRIKADIRKINNTLQEIIHEMDLNPCKPFSPVKNQQLLYTEISIGSTHHEIKTDELVEFFSRLTLTQQLHI